MKKIKKVAVSNIPAINGAVVDSFNAGVDKTTNAPSIRAVEEILENYSIEQRITTGEEFATNEWIDGKRVYGKRINCGNLPSQAGIMRVNHNTSFSEVVRVEAIANGGGYFHPVPYVSVSGMGEISEYSICACVDNSVIYLAVGRDRSDMVAKVTIYYTKSVSPTPV